MNYTKKGIFRTSALIASAAIVGAIMLPSAATAATEPTDNDVATSGGYAVIPDGDNVQIVVDGRTTSTPPGGAHVLTTKKVGGGQWIYGVGGGFSYSYYEHDTATHRSTACSGFGTSCKGSGWTKAKTRSVAKILRTEGGNTAYWDKK